MAALWAITPIMEIFLASFVMMIMEQLYVALTASKICVKLLLSFIAERNPPSITDYYQSTNALMTKLELSETPPLR